MRSEIGGFALFPSAGSAVGSPVPPSSGLFGGGARGGAVWDIASLMSFLVDASAPLLWSLSPPPSILQPPFLPPRRLLAVGPDDDPRPSFFSLKLVIVGVPAESGKNDASFAIIVVS